MGCTKCGMVTCGHIDHAMTTLTDWLEDHGEMLLSHPDVEAAFTVLLSELEKGPD